MTKKTIIIIAVAFVLTVIAVTLAIILPILLKEETPQSRELSEFSGFDGLKADEIEYITVYMSRQLASGEYYNFEHIISDEKSKATVFSLFSESEYTLFEGLVKPGAVGYYVAFVTREGDSVYANSLIMKDGEGNRYGVSNGGEIKKFLDSHYKENK